MKIKKLIKLFIFFLFLLLASQILLKYLSRNAHLNFNSLNTSSYVDIADEASKGKVQVNWEYLVAIDGVRYSNDFSKATAQNIRNLADMFIVTTNINKYKLLTLDEVLDKLSLRPEEKQKAYTYLNDLRSNIEITSNSSNQKFIDELYPEAVEIYKRHKILPSITIGQAALESGWGTSGLSTKANNLFGIKADTSWKGNKIAMKTSEYYNQTIIDQFRSYPNREACLLDYEKFLVENKRYRENGIFNCSYYLIQAQVLENAGYSTLKNETGENIYADRLIELIQENNLQLLDNKTEMALQK